MRYRLAIFDFDGTLADSFPFFASAFNQLATHHRFRSISEDEVPALRSMHPLEIMRHVGMRRWKMPFVAAHFLRLMREHRAGVSMFAGIPDVLSELATRGMQLSIVSSNSLDNVQAVLSPEVAKHVSHFGCGSSLFGKRRHILRALRLLQMPPSHAIYIGDQVTDLEAAHAAGIAFGAVAWGYAEVSALEAAGSDEVFHSVAELSRLAS